MADTPQIWRSLVDADRNDPLTESLPDVIQLATGQILVGWTSANTAGVGSVAGADEIGRFYDLEGNVLGSEMRLNGDFFLDDEQLGTMAALPFGLSTTPGFLFAYADFDGTTSTLLLERTSAEGTVIENNEIAVENSTFHYLDISLAVSGNSSALITFVEDTSGSLGYDRVSVSLYNPTDSTVSGPVVLFQNNVNRDDIAGVDSTVLSNTAYVVTAGVANGTDGEIWFERLAPGGVQAGLQKIASTVGDTDNDYDPSIAALNNGRFVIAWTNTDANDTDVMFQIHNAAGATVGAPVTIKTGLADNQKDPVVVGTSDGGFVIILDDDATSQIVAYHFNANGSQLGEGRVLAAGSSALRSPDAVLLDDGRIAVTWSRGSSDVEMAIIDTRDTAQSGQYPGTVTVGTIGDDIITAAGLAIGHQGNDILRDGAGTTDTLRGGAGNDLFEIIGVDAGESISGGPGIDTLSGTNFANGTTFDLLAQTLTAGAVQQDIFGIEVVSGSLASEVFLGSGRGDTMSGGAGNDRFDGRFGADLLFGEAGNDTIDGGNNGDTIYGGIGNDSILGNFGADQLFGNDGADRMFGGGSVDTMRGGAGNDYLTGQFDADLLFGEGGNDTLFGGEGKDTLDGGDGRDSLIGGVANDSLSGGRGSDTLRGGDDLDTLAGGGGNDLMAGNGGADLLAGGIGDDTLFGDGQADRLIGGDGNDILVGGLGGDRFIFATGFDNDRILDWQDGLDRLDFSALDEIDNLFEFRAHSFQRGADVVVSLSDGSSILIDNANRADFTNADIIF